MKMMIINEKENSQEKIKDANEINDDNKNNIYKDTQQNGENENLNEMGVFVNIYKNFLKENKFNDNELADELIDKKDNIDNQLELTQNFQQNEIINNFDGEIENIIINKNLNTKIINTENSKNTINEIFEHLSYFLENTIKQSDPLLNPHNNKNSQTNNNNISSRINTQTISNNEN